MAPRNGSKSLEVRQLKTVALNLSAGLLKRLEEISTFDFPIKSPQRLIDLLERIVKQIQNRICVTDNADELRLICHTIYGHGEYLDCLDNAHTGQTPRGLVLVLEDILQRIDPSAEILAFPESTFNYSIRDIIPDLRDFAENLYSASEIKKLFLGFEGPFYLVSFPRIERDNILGHAMFGHEIGHLIVDEYLDYEVKFGKYKNALKAATEKVKKEIEADADPQLDLFIRTKYEQEAIRELLEIRKRGLQEIVSDCIAILIFGPSALFAMYYFLFVDNLDQEPTPDDFYPPARYRFRIAEQFMRDEGFTETVGTVLQRKRTPESARKLFKVFVAQLKHVGEDNTDIRLIDSDMVTKLAYEWIQKSLHDALKFARKRVKDISYKKGLVRSEIPELIERLRMRLPPNEIGTVSTKKTVDWRSCILASWLYSIGLLESLGRFGDIEEDEEKRTIQQLTLKAIEYVILSSNYEAFVFE